MHFELEREMRTIAIDQLPKHLEINSSYAFALEVPLTYKVADIGFAPFSTIDLNLSAMKSLINLRSKELWLLAYWILGNEIEYSRNTEVLIEHLLKWKIIKISDNHEFMISSWFRSHFGPLFMVELKISRWKEALEQAIFYQQMSDYSSVVLDASCIYSVPIEKFEKNGIGLFIASQNTIQNLVKPQLSPGMSVQQRILNQLSVLKDLSRKNPRKWEFVKRGCYESFSATTGIK
ncbi:MAG: hypothetical protein JEZ06_00430 [Anaerolineaceae bacterium]|nr:hypothetical protein [Anaerolineaceae bacterium]